VSINRLYFHSLARYPGPLLWRVSILPSLYYAWTGDRHLVVDKLHKAYGTYLKDPQGDSQMANQCFHGRQGSADRTQSCLDMYSKCHQE
jgi:hypothetical protein